MAARQDQTLQIALIVSVFLLLVSLVLFYWFFKQNSDAHQQITSLESEISTEKTAVRNKEAEAETLRLAIGADQFAQIGDVEGQFAKDMTTMAGTLPEAQRNYRAALTLVFKEKVDVVFAHAADKEAKKTLETKLLEVEAGHQIQMEQLKDQIAKIEQQAAAARNEFNQARAALNASKDSLDKQLTKQTDQFDKERAEKNSQIADLGEKTQTLQKAIDRYIEDRTVEDFSFEVADGRITWVNQANNTAWIDLGSADALRRQVTFSVHDTEETDAGKAEIKGSVEVVRMLSDHMAECRVTDDDPRNPILPGDYIFSHVWHAGRPQHFALTGIIDLDGDGRDDLQLAKDLIALNGGVVDASPAKEGGVDGEITIETRYLVLGEFPEGTGKSELRKAWDDMSSEAKANGVEKINLTDFMNQMGYKPEDRTVNLGRGIRSDDFRPRPNANSSDLRPRSPYTRP